MIWFILILIYVALGARSAGRRSAHATERIAAALAPPLRPIQEIGRLLLVGALLALLAWVWFAAA